MPNVNPNSLALRRRQLGYAQKHIAALLGHNTTHQICRYETGQRVPGLKDALKLSLIYGLPVRALFDPYFHLWRDELKNRLKKSGLAANMTIETDRIESNCSYLESLNSDFIDEPTADGIRRHIKVLVEERSKKILSN